MKSKLLLLAASACLAIPVVTFAAPLPPPMRESVAVCDPAFPNNCAKPNSSGQLPITTGTGTTSQQVQGTSASNATDDGSNPVKIGCVFLTVLPTLTNNQRGNCMFNPKGALYVSPPTSATGSTAAVSSPGADGVTPNNTLFVTPEGPLYYNGVGTGGTSQYDQVRTINGALVAGNAGTGSTAVEEGGTLFSEITSATTTAVKGTPAILHQICINTLVGAATIKAYNATTATGTPITITLPATITGDSPFCMKYDIYMSTALTVVTSGATDITVTYR